MSMLLFCEYVVLEPHLEHFRHWTEMRKELWQNAQLLENTEQIGVTVEIWPVADEEAALRIQKERLGGRSEWLEMAQWIKGGQTGLRMWTFRPLLIE